MDVNDREVFEEFSEQAQENATSETQRIPEKPVNENPFPPADYDKNGKVKTLRGRMLKKLLKYEFRAVMPALYLCLGLLAGMTVLECIACNLLHTQIDFDETLTFIIVASILYAYAAVSTVVVPVVVSIRRYYTNFFKDEGYLTFSIPATMEEQITAKHVSGFIATCIGCIASIISVSIVFLASPSLNEWIGIGDIVSEYSAVSYGFIALEELLSGIIGLAAIFCVAGALSCWGQKFTKKAPLILRIVLVYVAWLVIQSFAISLGGDLLVWFETTEAGLHVGNVLKILAYAAIAVSSVAYERHYLKRKLI